MEWHTVVLSLLTLLAAIGSGVFAYLNQRRLRDIDKKEEGRREGKADADIEHLKTTINQLRDELREFRAPSTLSVGDYVNTLHRTIVAGFITLAILMVAMWTCYQAVETRVAAREAAILARVVVSGKTDNAPGMRAGIIPEQRRNTEDDNPSGQNQDSKVNKVRNDSLQQGR